MPKKTIAINVPNCRLSIRCRNCGCSVVFDFSTPDEHGKLLASRTPEMCPGCGRLTNFDIRSETSHLLGLYRIFLDATKKTQNGFDFQFLVPVDD